MDPAIRARKAVSGELSTKKSVKGGKFHLVVVPEEASDNTKKELTNMCTCYKIPTCLFRAEDELGHVMGQEPRVSLSVENAGFARSMIE